MYRLDRDRWRGSLDLGGLDRRELRGRWSRCLIRRVGRSKPLEEIPHDHDAVLCVCCVTCGVLVSSV